MVRLISEIHIFDLFELCFFPGFGSDAVSVHYAANFPESTARATKAVAEFRRGRKETVPASMDDWKVEYHLIAFSHRIKPVKVAFTKLMDAGLHVFRVLWPDAEIPQMPLSRHS